MIYVAVALIVVVFAVTVRMMVLAHLERREPRPGEFETWDAYVLARAAWAARAKARGE